jgi:hypothetical protein
MDNKELTAAANVLIQWFNSQDIASRDAEEIMSKITAKLIIARGTSPQDITDEVGKHHLKLTKDLADRIYQVNKDKRG